MVASGRGHRDGDDNDDDDEKRQNKRRQPGERDASADGEPSKQPPGKQKSNRSGDTGSASTSGATSCSARPSPADTSSKGDDDNSMFEEEAEARRARVNRYVVQHQVLGEEEDDRIEVAYLEKRDVMYKKPDDRYFVRPARKNESLPRDLREQIPEDAADKDRRVMGQASSSTPRRESETGSHVSRKSAKSKRSASSSKSSPCDPKQCTARSQRGIEHQKRTLYQAATQDIDAKDRWKSKCGATCCEPVEGEKVADYYLQPALDVMKTYTPNVKPCVTRTPFVSLTLLRTQLSSMTLLS